MEYVLQQAPKQLSKPSSMKDSVHHGIMVMAMTAMDSRGMLLCFFSFGGRLCGTQKQMTVNCDSCGWEHSSAPLPPTERDEGYEAGEGCEFNPSVGLRGRA